MSVITVGRSRRGAAVLLAGSLVAASGLLASPAAAGVVPAPVAGKLVAANPVDVTPHALNGEVRAFAEIGDTIYVGGSFTQLRTAASATKIAQPYLFSYNKKTGAVSGTFKPKLDGAVSALLVNSAGKLVVGGAFRNVNGVERRNLVAVDPSSGATVSSWVGKSDGGNVRTLKQYGGKIYVGGAFNYLNGVERHGLARVDSATGAIDAGFVVDATGGRNSVAPYVWTMDIAPNGRTLVIGGNFTLVNKASRNQIAVLDLSATGAPTLANWSTTRYVPPCIKPQEFTHYVQDIDFSDDGTYFIVGSNGGEGWPAAYCDTLARFETATRGTGLDASWIDLTGNDTITSVEATGNVIYLGGHFRWLNNPNAVDKAGTGAVDRLGIAAVDPGNGMPIAWNPRRSGAPTGTTAWGSAVPVIWKGADGIYVGQNSDGLGNEYHGRLAMFPTTGGRTVAAVQAPTAATGYLWSGGTAKKLKRTAFNGTTLGASTTVTQANMTGTGIATRAGDKLYWDKSGKLVTSTVTGAGVVGASWATGYNSWYSTSALTGAFYLSGRLYYTKSTADKLYYRYLEPDGHIVGATEFSVATTGIKWSTVRGLTWVNGSIVYGNTDGKLRKVTFTPTAATVATSSTVKIIDNGKTWTSKTLYFAAS
nr:delta-60 repeat domain-containing protein [Actinoplanes lichenis]